MAPVLCIDISSSPAYGVLVEFTDKKVKIVEKHSQELGTLPLPSRDWEENSEPDSSERSDAPEENGGKSEFAQNFQTLLNAFSHEWTRSLLIVPPHRSLALNLELPFGNAKSISKILELEVQDKIPFSTEEFLLSATPLGVLGAGQFDVHVGLTPRPYVSSLLSEVSSETFEPALITVPSSVLNAVHFLAPSYCSENSAVVYGRPEGLAISFTVNGEARTGRLIPLPAPNGIPDGERLQKVYAEAKLALAACERRYNMTFDKVYLMGEVANSRALQQMLGRETEDLPIRDLIPNCPSEYSLAALGSVFAQDKSPPPLLNNLRTGDFAFRPQFRELISGLKRLTFAATTTLVSVTLCLLLTYWIRDYRLTQLQDAMSTQVERIIPAADVSHGGELEFVQGLYGRLNAQLKEIGSATKISAAEALAQLAQDFRRFTSLEVSRLNVTGEIITIQGYAPNYGKVEEFQRRLGRKKDFYCDIGDKTTAAGSKKVGFDFRLTLCG